MFIKLAKRRTHSNFVNCLFYLNLLFMFPRKSVTHHYYRGAQAIVLVYDVTSKASLTSLEHWLVELEDHGIGPEVPRVLVGNKCDEAGTEVSTTDAQRWADDRGMPLFETSAKDDSQSDHIESIFLTLAHKLKSGKPLIRFEIILIIILNSRFTGMYFFLKNHFLPHPQFENIFFFPRRFL